MPVTTRLNLLLRAAAILSAAGLMPGVAAAQTYPAHPVTVIVPFAAGGPSDVLGRLLAAAMSTDLGQTMIVENVGGAGGNVGTGRVAHAVPDGYTLLFTTNAIATSPALYPDLNYDPVTDFADIGEVSVETGVLLTRKDFPVDGFAELIAYLKANGDKTSFGTTGAGGASDLSARMLMKAIGTKFTLVPYKGASQTLTDLIAGRLDVTSSSVVPAAPQVAAGSVKAFAILGNTRFDVLPNVPTFPELGMPEMATGIWTALFAPRNTPPPIIDRLVSGLHAALQNADFQAQLAKTGGDQLVPLDQANPQALAAFLKSEIARWGPLLKETPAANP